MKLKNYLPFLFIIFIWAVGCNSSNKQKAAKAEIKNTDGFLFVGMIESKPGICKYSFSEEKYFPVWQSAEEKVTELTYSSHRESAFFITASSEGKKGVFPFINDVKVYLVNPGSEKVKFVSEVGSGMQVFAGWQSDSTFKIVLNSFDKENPNQIDQRSLLFESSGEMLLDKTETYNIEKVGFPASGISDASNYDDESGNYQIISSNNSITSISLVNESKQDTLLITKVNQRLNEFKFTEDGKYLIFTTLNVKPSNETLYDTNPRTSKLFVYSMKDKTIKKIFEGGGEKNFFIMNNKLIFDDGFKEKSNIKIYDISNSKLIKEINIKGGSGLKNIPELPDYSA